MAEALEDSNQKLISNKVQPSLPMIAITSNSINTLPAEIVIDRSASTIYEPPWYQLPEVNNMMDLISLGLSVAVIFGGLVPYIPQYVKIKKISNSEGFSTYVCLTLLVANILRILFWFGHRFDTPLLLQSFVMVIGMLAMMELCIRVRSRSRFNPLDHRNHTIGDASLHNETDPIYSVYSSHISEVIESNTDPLLSPSIQLSRSNHPSHKSCYNLGQFWQWTDLLSYVQFLVSFSIVASLITFLMIDNNIYIEGLGFLAVFTESLLGMPQLLRNFSKKSTRGMSVEMVVMWLSGDIFKTTYFLLRHTPAQFWICGTVQIILDIIILFQSFYYGSTGPYHKLPKTF